LSAISTGAAVIEYVRLTPEGLDLDGVHFRAAMHEREIASANGIDIGELDLDEITNEWRACFGDNPWLAMRSRTEARAFIISWQNTGSALIRAWAFGELVA
jgi:hypothetical protein